MPIWPCDLANFVSPFPILFVLLLLANCGPLVRSQATCAFVRADFAHFLADDTPTEPQIAEDLSLCRPFFRRPSAVSCCTRRMEAKFEQFAREQLLSAVIGEIGIIRKFFNDWSTIFRAEFSQALNRTERTLRHIFQRTYGQFFTQHIEMFDSFFSQLRSLLSPSAPASSSFGAAFRQLLQRIFLAEFALLNPLRSSDLPSHAQCLLNFFPAFAPFGSVPNAIVALHGRTFGAWVSFIDALDSVGEAVQSLGRSFALSSHCVRSVVRMRFCPICLGHSSQIRPCPALCQHIFQRCLRNLSAISPQWDGLINSLALLGPSLASVHNPHFSLASFPFQLSEAIMHFQENAKTLSGRIVFRCFGEDFNKIATDGQTKLRRKRNLDTETEDDLEEGKRRGGTSKEHREKEAEERENGREEKEEKENGREEGEEKEEEQWEREEEERSSEEEEGEEEEEENGEGQRQQVETSALHGGASDAASPTAASAPLLLSVLSLRRSIELFMDRLLRLKGFWRGIGQMLCQEGGVQAESGRAIGEKCWAGTGGADEGERADEQSERQKHRNKTKLTREMLQMEAIAKRIQTANGMRTNAAEKGEQWTEKAKSTGETDDDDGPDNGHQSYESVGKWWQWTEMEEQNETNKGRGRMQEGKVGIGTLMAISSTFFFFDFLFLTQ